MILGLRMPTVLRWAAIALACGVFTNLPQSLSAAEVPNFEQQILPLLYNRCFSCHSEKADQPKGDLRLDSVATIVASNVIVPGKPDDSELVKRISLQPTDEQHMPPIQGGSQPLSDAERDLVKRWIADGAKTGSWRKFNHREPPQNVVGDALSRASVVQLAEQLDVIVQAGHREKKIQRNPPLTDEEFLRRVYLDVAGRIPSWKESREFLDSSEPNKRATLIDRLLDSEAFVSHAFNWKADQLRLVSKGIPGQPGWIYDEWVKQSLRSGMKYDEFVRQLITARGYLWENGAVGFYLRDLGMPLDHMSNLSRIFLGTRIECAQCHDHPYEPVTQRDFYQLTAYTFGVSNLYSSAGYSTDHVRHWRELQRRLDAMNASEALRQAVSITTAPLKRLTTDTSHELKFPDNYANDAKLRGKAVEPRTPFGDEAPSSLEDRRSTLAHWMTSPRNPRFAKNIANRLWKRVMGAGLIEPVDSLSPVNRPEFPEVLDFLTQTIVRLGFDERAYLAMVLNSRTYQSQSVRKELEPGAPHMIEGPLLRRLSAEQIWDSMLVLLVEDLDDRKPRRDDQGPISREQLSELTRMTADEMMQRSRETLEFREAQRRHTIETARFKAAIQAAKENKNDAEVRRLQNEYSQANDQFELIRERLRMETSSTKKESDSRWSTLSGALVRASEIPTPIAIGHFLRQFGQSDRREIDAFNKQANVTHSLAMMNGELTRLATEEKSFVRRSVRSVESRESEVRAIYLAVLVRSPNADELQKCLSIYERSSTPVADLIWALVNSPEFLFIQ